jgi:YVTN family beta-propeller protein
MQKQFLLLCFILNLLVPAFSQKQVVLPNGWKLSPAGKSLPLGDLPLNIAVSNSKKMLAVTNNGQSKQSLQLIEVASQRVIDQVTIEKSWLGLKFSADEKYLYAAGGNDNRIWKYAIINKKLNVVDSFILGEKWPNKISPAGIEIDEARNLLYVVTKDNNSIYLFDLKTKKIKGIYPLKGEAYTCLLSPDKNTLYVSCWGCDQVVLFDTKGLKIKAEIPVGDNPNELCLNKTGSLLYVTNANDNSVSVINTNKNTVIETLISSLYPDAPQGSTSNGLALSADEKTLLIANADNNSLAVFDVSQPGFSKSKGFIPVGWYPTCVRVVGKKNMGKQRKRLLIICQS